MTTKRLILVCHPEFIRNNPMLGDKDRLLGSAGRRQAAVMARRLSRVAGRPDRLVISSAVRCAQTADIYAKKLGLSSSSVWVDESLYEAECTDMLRVVQALDDSDRMVMLLGHPAGLTKLLQHLADSDVRRMPEGAFAVLDLPVESWRAVAFKCGVLAGYDELDQKEESRGLWWRFVFWRRQKVQKVELFVIFMIGLLLVLASVFFILHLGSNAPVQP